MSWVCSEFRVGPREALRTLGYDPDDVPHDLLSLMGEARRFAEVHREYERVIGPGTKPGDGSRALAQLKQHPLWPDYEAALLERMQDGSCDE